MLMRRKIADLVYSQMEKDKNVWVIVADLGYKMWDQCFLDFPDRCINVGASEQSMIGIAVGLSLSGKIVFCYSISTFLLYRPFEWIRNFLSWGQVPVKLLAGGRDKDYEIDGITHDASDIKKYMPDVVQYWPEKEEELDKIFREMLMNKKPSFLSLRR